MIVIVVMIVVVVAVVVKGAMLSDVGLSERRSGARHYVSSSVPAAELSLSLIPSIPPTHSRHRQPPLLPPRTPPIQWPAAVMLVSSRGYGDV